MGLVEGEVVKLTLSNDVESVWHVPLEPLTLIVLFSHFCTSWAFSWAQGPENFKPDNVAPSNHPTT